MAKGDEEPKKVIPPQPSTSDEPALAPGEPDTALLEAMQLGSGLTRRDLKRESDEADHDRGQKFKDHFEWMSVFTIWTLFGGFLALGGVWGFHLMAPQWGWLTPAQLDKLQGLLTGGIIAGLVSDHVRKRMG